MVRDPSLREVVGPDALRPVAGAHLGAPGRVDLVLVFLLFDFKEPRRQDLEGPLLVLMLRPLILTLDHRAGRQMGDADGGVRLVDVLPAGAARAERVDLEFALVDLELHFVRFRQDRDRRGGRLDASLALGLGDPLHTVDARLEFEAGVGAVAGDLERDLLVPAEFGRVGTQDFCLEALGLRVHGIHAQKRAREQGGLFPAGAASDLDDDVFVVVRVPRQQQDLELFRGLFQSLLRGGHLLLGKVPELFVGTGILQDGLRLVEVFLRLLIDAVRLHDGRHILVLLQERGVLFDVGDDFGVRELLLELQETALDTG